MFTLEDLQPNASVRGVLPNAPVTIPARARPSWRACSSPTPTTPVDTQASAARARAIVMEFTGDTTHRVHYLRQPFQHEPDFSVNYDFAELLARAEPLR